jgi:hypothetical protein
MEAALPKHTTSRADLLEYQQAIRSIMYTMLESRPDLAFTISTLLKHYSNPAPMHASSAQRTLQYLQKTINVGITFGGQENLAVADATAGMSSITGITGFTDAD